MYTLLLAMPFPAVAVRPDPRPASGIAVWRREQSSRRDMNLRDMPILLPEIPADQYHLPELVGRLFDVTVLSRDVLRPWWMLGVRWPCPVRLGPARPSVLCGLQRRKDEQWCLLRMMPTAASSCRCRAVAAVGVGPPQSKVAVCCQCWSLTPPGSPVFAYMQWESECWQCWWCVAEYNNRCSSVAGY